MTPDDDNNSNGNGNGNGNGNTNGAGGGDRIFPRPSLAADYLRTLFVAWFAANDAYWPHEKRPNA